LGREKPASRHCEPAERVKQSTAMMHSLDFLVIGGLDPRLSGTLIASQVELQLRGRRQAETGPAAFDSARVSGSMRWKRACRILARKRAVVTSTAVSAAVASHSAMFREPERRFGSLPPSQALP
jgi:hypothetical protein